MLNGVRLAAGLLLTTAAILVGMGSSVSLGMTGTAQASVSHGSSSLWISCNDSAATRAPAVFISRLKEVTASHSEIPASFASSPGYRGDIAKVVCYESTYNFHAAAPNQYGWFQMSRSLISGEGVSWNEYWSGNSSHAAGWYQCLAGELYIKNRYGTPAAAWQHERDYGWY